MKIAVINPPWYYWTEKESKNKMPKDWLPYDDRKGYYAGKYEKRCGIRAGSRWPHTIEVHSSHKTFPMNLAYVTSILKNQGHNVIYVDSITARHTYDQFYYMMKNFRPDFVVSETGGACEENDMQVLEKLFKLTNAKIVLVGGTAAAKADEFVKKPFIYSVCKGDYVVSATKAINNNVKGVIEAVEYRLDDLPFPYRHDDTLWLIEEKTHGEYGFNSKTGRKINIISSRGCPYQCAFCDTHVLYPKIKMRSIPSLEKEIQYIIDRFGREVFIFFDDDTFNFNRERTVNIAKMLGKYRVPWSFLGRIDTMTEDDWDILVENGLTSVNVGIESASQRILDAMKKNLNIEEAKHFIKYLLNKGVYVNIALVYDFEMGDIKETPEEKEMSTRLVEELGVSNRTRASAVPLPGSTMWNNLEDKNKNMDGYIKIDDKTKNERLKNERGEVYGNINSRTT